MTRKLLDGAIIAPSDFSVIELENPPAWANVQFGTYDVEIGEKLSDINAWNMLNSSTYSGGRAIRTAEIGDGFIFSAMGQVDIYNYDANSYIKYKVFIDGQFDTEIIFQGTDTVRKTWSKDIGNTLQNITVVLSDIYTSSFVVDYITISQSTVIDNPGVETYPKIEIEPIPTVKRYRVMDEEQINIYASYIDTSGPVDSPTQMEIPSAEITAKGNMYFLDGQIMSTSTGTIGFRRAMLFNLGIDEEEMSHASSLIADVWAYGRGALTTNADFANGLDSWSFSMSTGASASASVADGICEVTVNEGGENFGYVRLYQWLGTYPSGAKFRTRIRLKASKTPSKTPRLRTYSLTTSSTLDDQYLNTVNTEWQEFSTDVITLSTETDLRILFYFGGDDDIVYYIDYITVEAYGAEMYVYRDDLWWIVSAATHNQISPSKMRFDVLPDDIYSPSDYIHDGIFPVLIVPTYPSDGVSGGTTYVDYYEVETTSQYAKLSSNFLVNTVDNLVPPFTSDEWENYDHLTTIISDYKARKLFSGAAFSGRSEVSIPVKPNTTYSKSIKNLDSTCRYIARFLDKDMQQIGSDILEVNTTFTTPENIAYIRLIIYIRSTGSAVIGQSYIFENPILTQTDTPQAFKPQRKYTLSTDTPITVTSGEIVSIDGTLIKSYKNSESVLESISQNSKDTGFKILQGVNYLDFSISGGFAKVSVVDEGTNKVAAIDEEYLPHMTKIEESAEDLAEYTQTPGGATRMDLIVLNGDIVKAGKKSWNIETPWIDVSEANRFINYLKSKHFVHVTFWLDEFGGGGKAVTALIRPSSIKVVREGARTYNLRKLTFTVEEA